TTSSVWRARMIASSTGRTSGAGTFGARLRIDGRSFLSGLVARLWSGPRLLGRGGSFRAKTDEVPKDAGDGCEDRHQPQGTKDGPGETDRGRNLGIARQAVPLRMIPVGEHGDHRSASHPLRIIETRVRETVGLELLDALRGEREHRVLGSKVQTPGGARLDASGLQTDFHPVDAEGALGHFAGLGGEPGNVERTAGLAQPAS